MPATHHTVFYRQDALPANQSTCQSTEGMETMPSSTQIIILLLSASVSTAFSSAITIEFRRPFLGKSGSDDCFFLSHGVIGNTISVWSNTVHDDNQDNQSQWAHPFFVYKMTCEEKDDAPLTLNIMTTISM